MWLLLEGSSWVVQLQLVQRVRVLLLLLVPAAAAAALVAAAWRALLACGAVLGRTCGRWRHQPFLLVL
jgi:hypothetical protein